ncbi:class I SAM-dependent methyltransferase [Bradyrhizobium sp. ARR65]|uniref:class I SAM-dependent methyltransferase n=1 Tax=Bradyrhizobium sp. ARR65 TaxID=1040989 RepID=UPI0005593B3C|nr:class I SAM-dependent methyltransferase [Bradyrhizobium sp. ARR65]
MPEIAQTVDPEKLNAFVGRMLGDLAALTNSVLVHVGDHLGLYKKLATSGPVTSAALAKQTGTSERLVREWLSAQSAQGYVSYDKESGAFSLSPEQAMVFADEDSPVFLAGFFDVARGLFDDTPKIVNAFRADGKLAWHEHNGCLFCGTQRVFRPAYNHHLINEWLPALDGVVAKLERGARVADVGCGHGASTILMAKAFPNARFFGYDYHPASIEAARQAATKEGVADRISFEVGTAKTYPAKEFDLVCFFDCLHDMGDPVGAARHVSETLKPDGTWMVVEPFAHDKLEENFNPVGAVFYAASTVVCTPASLAQEVGLALGAQAGEARLNKVITEGGFTRVHRAAETPFNMVLEARL